MSTDARKRHRQKLKRQKKRIQVQRAHSGSPVRRIALGGEVVACYINRDWRETGMISLHILRRRMDGGHTMGAFLIDPWCIGLKDAYGRLSMTPSEFREDVIGRLSGNMDLERVDVDAARRLVAGAVRFSHQNGFRLPAKWDRWVRVLGDLGDWRTADLSDFGVNGKLRFVGSVEDLCKRLIGSTVEKFLARKDVDYLLGPPVPFDMDDDFSEGEWEEADDGADIIEESISGVLERALERVRQWCFANHVVPSPRLPEVIEHTLRAAGVILVESDEGDEPDETQLQEAHRSLESLLMRQSGQDAIDFGRAMEQMQGFIQQFPTPEDFIATLGLPGENETEP